MSVQPRKASAPSAKQIRRPANTRGNIRHPSPGIRDASVINCAEISRACDKFLLARVPGYRIMNYGGARSD